MDDYLQLNLNANFDDTLDMYLSVNGPSSHFPEFIWNSVFPQLVEMQNETKGYLR